MIIFHFEAAKAMIADVIAEWTDLPGELDTITGYTIEEYQALAHRLHQGGAQPTKQDREMLRHAANQLFGYPGISTTHCREALGERWQEVVVGFRDN